MEGQIDRIKGIYSDLNELRENGKVYNQFETKVKLILLELHSLYSATSEKTEKDKYESAIMELDHTFNKEVLDIKLYEREMKRKISLKVELEYQKIITKAYDHIYRDLFQILN